jgi:hypothetical protein
MQNLYLRNVRISRIEVLDATQSLLIYCFLRTTRGKKGQWLQLLSLRNVRKNGIESLALWYIIVIHWIIAFCALCAKWASLLLMVILRKLRKNKCLRRLCNPTSLRNEGFDTHRQNEPR